MNELLDLQKLSAETAIEEEQALSFSSGVCVGTGTC